VTAVGLMPRSKKVVLSQKGFGEFTLQLDLYPDIRFVVFKPDIHMDRQIFICFRFWEMHS